MESKLIEWCRRQWDKKRVVTRGIIFRRALMMYPDHCKADSGQSQFKKLCKWFYGGFKKRCKLSKRRISSTGQKLPQNWQELVVSIVNRVAGAQMPTQRMDGSFCPGVTDDKMGNTDQVPVYIEDHSKATWGEREDRGRRMVGMAGKEKRIDSQPN